jgi:hypothetical protein
MVTSLMNSDETLRFAVKVSVTFPPPKSVNVAYIQGPLPLGGSPLNFVSRSKLRACELPCENASPALTQRMERMDFFRLLIKVYG